jgi:hypothetical protein
LHCVTTTEVNGWPGTLGASFSTGTSVRCATRSTSVAHFGPTHELEATVLPGAAAAAACVGLEVAHPCAREAVTRTARDDISLFMKAKILLSMFGRSRSARTGRPGTDRSWGPSGRTVWWPSAPVVSAACLADPFGAQPAIHRIARPMPEKRGANRALRHITD